jgi:hypothetical protein
MNTNISATQFGSAPLTAPGTGTLAPQPATPATAQGPSPAASINPDLASRIGSAPSLM